MRRWVARNWKELTFFPSLMVLVTVYVACTGTTPAPETPAVTADCTYSNYNGSNQASYSSLLPVTSLECPALPNTPPGFENTSTTPSSYYEHFAWKSFIALNWPAVNTTAYANYPRGFPDYNQSFTSENNPALTVWQSWKEKREIFVYGADPAPDPGPWNSLPNYHNEDIPECNNSEFVAQKRAAGTRYLLQTGQTGPIFDDLSESVEVPSESGPDTTIPGGLVKPRVWVPYANGTPNLEKPILYEVKLNYDYYNYTRTYQLYNDTIKNNRAALSGNWSKFHVGAPGSTSSKAVNFPRRASFDIYDADTCETQNMNYSADHPCVTGTIQTKAAWLQIDESEIPSYSDYHVSEALYYRDDASAPDGICVDHGYFALQGFHIIQKTENQHNYLYATWEHNGLADESFVYSNYKLYTDTYGDQGWHPALNESGIKVQRAHAINSTTNSTIDAVNKLYQSAIAGNNSQSVWQNYQLIGAQFLPVTTSDRGSGAGDDFTVGSNDPTNIGQPFYMANLLVETNWGLQNFQGVPPSALPVIGPNPPYDPTTGFSTVYKTGGQAYEPNPNGVGFDRALNNTGGPGRQFGTMNNMGGCMGCHGIAQGNGTDFSFVLLLGQQGAKPETITSVPDID